jgi:hypothetical protein
MQRVVLKQSLGTYFQNFNVRKSFSDSLIEFRFFYRPLEIYEASLWIARPAITIGRWDKLIGVWGQRPQWVQGKALRS